MSLPQFLSDAQHKADANGDGKLSFEDIQALASQHGLDRTILDDLKAKNDVNNDGKIDLEDLKSTAAKFNFEDMQRHAGNAFEDASKNAGEMFDNAKDKLFGNK